MAVQQIMLTLMRTDLFKRLLLLGLVAAIASLGLTACKCSHGQTGTSAQPAKSEPPAKSEHPEHPK